MQEEVEEVKVETVLLVLTVAEDNSIFDHGYYNYSVYLCPQ